ncbi:MAG: DNA mismatch endonuclease Vsr [Chloroflexi bacterium]|nr:DNA mismatch endonuclease Vsr [Chloroflexota bacterium]
MPRAKTTLMPLPPAPPATSPAVRSSMVGNRSANTRPEQSMRDALTALGLDHFVLHPALPGKPDITFYAEKVAVFVHGCYWHRCPHCSPHFPSTNQDYWTAKFARNRARDKRNTTALKELGWLVVVVWECKVRKNPKQQARRVQSWMLKREQC